MGAKNYRTTDPQALRAQSSMLEACARFNVTTIGGVGS
jgi:hypothetical protein